MKHDIIYLLIALALTLAPARAAATALPAMVPTPASYESATGEPVPVPPIITVGGLEARRAADQLTMRGYHAKTARKKPFLTLVADNSLPPEGYRLNVTPAGVTIASADHPGCFYAIETLTQLLDQAGPQGLMPCSIADSPRMAYRGLMLDVVRCYIPIGEILKLVDIASQLKVNKLHLHLTDDNGWRLEIKRYPRLTEVGAWRVDRPELFPARVNAREGEPATYGGYYTQEEMRRLVAYAAERCIDVVPEIEMPAHSIGAIASYPELACPVTEGQFIGVLPGIGGEAASIIMCAGKDSTIEFVKNVLDEVMDIFPYEYIHIGGDEADKSHWKQCPLCNARIERHHLADHEALQGWFMDQIIAYVNAHGRQAIGWDEVTMGNPSEDLVIMGWRGNGDAAVNYARRTGRRFIMTPAKSCYMIRYQGPQWFEPFTYFGNITLRDAYEFEPVKADWTPQLKEQMLGMQASLWTEFCRTAEDMQYLLFPRMLAMADVAWRPEGHRDYAGFIAAVDSFLPRLERKGVTWARSMYNVQHTATPNGQGGVALTATCNRPAASIALWRGNPADNDNLVATTMSGQLTLTAPCSLTLQATEGGVEGRLLNLDFDFNRATGRTITSPNCNNELAHVMLNGLRGSLRNSDFEWAGWYDRTADFTVDLGREQPICSVQLGALGNADLNVALPRSMKLYAAGADGEFSLIADLSLAELQPESVIADDCFPQAAMVSDLDFGSVNANARYLRIVAENAGHVPAGYPRENNATWLYFDELVVK